MRHPFRQVVKQHRLSALSLVVVTTASLLTVSLGDVPVASADPRSFDMDPHPITLPAAGLNMTPAESEFVARQLEPVKRYVQRRSGPHPTPLAIVTPRSWGDPFVRDDWRIAERHRNGDVVRMRVSPIAQLAFPGSQTYQIVYRSTDGRGYPVLASASLVVPPHMKSDSAVFVWAQFQNSSGTHCDVSTQLTKPDTGILGVTPQIVTPVLAAGHPVLFTNGLGPRSAYPMNRSSSHYILDAMRMVHKQSRFALKKSPFVGLGVSHGALQMGYMAVEQPYYAPDLTRYIRQIIVNEGAPDMIKLANNLGMFGKPAEYPSSRGALLMNFIVGTAREYPDQVKYLEYWLTDRGKEVMKQASETCTPFSFIAGTGERLSTYFKPGFLKSKTFRSALQVAKDTSMIYFPGKPAVPVLLAHGDLDFILHQAEQDRIMHERWCRAGVNTVYQEIPIASHFTLLSLSAPRTVVTVIGALSGIPQQRNCPNPVII